MHITYGSSAGTIPDQIVDEIEALAASVFGGGGDSEGNWRRGIARELMNQQHLWLRERGYLSVETGARQSNFAMAQLNLESGFKVVGIRYKGDDPDIIYEKLLG